MRPSATLLSQAAPYISVVGIGGSILVAAIALPIGILLDSSGMVYLSTAFLAFAIPAAVGVARGRNFDPFEPINLIALAIFFGTSLRAVYLLTSESERAAFVMMGTNFENVAANAPWMLLSVVALVLGYLITPWRIPIEKFRAVRCYAVSRTRLNIAIGISVIITLVAIAMLAAREGLDISQGILSLSRKRAAVYTSDEGAVVYGVGYEAFLGQFAQYAFVLLSCVLLAGIAKKRLGTLVALVLLGALGCVTPFLVSSRSTIIIMLLSAAIAATYYGKLKAKVLVVIFLASIPLVVGMGYLRQVNHARGAVERAQGTSVLDSIIGSGNSLDFVRTSAIIDRIPSVRGYQWGWTYAALFSAPIPRAVWPEKPNPSLGPWVKRELYGKAVRNQGWPSGMIAEGYINFGTVGLIIPLFLFGALLRILYETCRPLLGVSLPVTAIYAVSIWRLGFGTIGLNFAHGMMQMLTDLAPMFLLVVIARAPLRQAVANGMARARRLPV